MSRFHSQHGEDRWIAEHVVLPDYGYAVEVGAADGVEMSNTLWLEERGWDGLLVEPDPRNLTGIEYRRRWQVFRGVAAPHNGTARLVMPGHPHLSGLARPDGRTLEVPSMRLGDLLKQYNIPMPFLLSIDTEGTEIDAWRSLSPAMSLPKVVIIEHWTMGLNDGADAAREVRAEFEPLGYEVGLVTQCNHVFVLK